MTPLRIEAVYERVPQGELAAAVRWGFRATLDRETARPDEPRPELAVDGAAVQLNARRSGLLPAPQRPVRGPRQGPREAQEDAPRPFPELLGYGPNGGAIPLLPASFGAAGLGLRLDLYA